MLSIFLVVLVLPDLCSFRRLSKLFVTPLYNLPQSSRRTYTLYIIHVTKPLLPARPERLVVRADTIEPCPSGADKAAGTTKLTKNTPVLPATRCDRSHDAPLLYAERYLSYTSSPRRLSEARVQDGGNVLASPLETGTERHADEEDV